MRFKILLLPALFFSLFTYAQTSGKVYGFYQEHSPGMVREGSKPMLSPADYRIYLRVPSAKEFSVGDVWVDGKAYKATARRVSGAATFRSPGTGALETIVPAAGSGQTLYQLTLEPITTARSLTPAARANAVIVTYYRSKVKTTSILKSLTRLEPKLSE